MPRVRVGFSSSGKPDPSLSFGSIRRKIGLEFPQYNSARPPPPHPSSSCIGNRMSLRTRSQFASRFHAGDVI